MNQKIDLLRAYLTENNLDAILVPRGDEWQGEYVAPYAERLQWLTGFGSSAGMAVITGNKAALFVDGRYTVAAKGQVDTNIFDIQEVPHNKLSDWLKAALPDGGRIGYDPWLFTADWIKRSEKTLGSRGFSLIACDINPIDTMWTGQPERPIAPVIIHSHEKAGQTAKQKASAVAKKITENRADAFLVTAADSIAWLFNIRGHDVPHTPYVLARALIHADGSTQLIIHPSRIPDDVKRHIGDHVTIIPPDALADRLHQMGQDDITLALDKTSCPQSLYALAHDAHLEPLEMTDPCEMMKAQKTKSEIEGSRTAHRNDALALVTFFKWVEDNHASGALTEWALSQKLHECRAANPAFHDDSFDAIVGWNAHGAIVHYRVTPESSLPITGDGLLLVDSGGQYDNGTTDITRTIALGTPTKEMKDRYTRVVKGHIALSTARFPKGTTGIQLDILARQSLWEVGLDYAHGTGHGVGAYLSVHEGPASISPRGKAIPLEAGMILSNEPGYYKENAYGIRFENLVLVVEDKNSGDENDMFAFETLSLFPLDAALLDKAMLTDDEKAWINAYHARVYQTLAPHLDDAHAAWLKARTLEV